MTQKKMIRIAKDEIGSWHSLPPGLVLAILFCFVHRISTGRTFEEDFGGGKPVIDYEI